MQTHASPAAQLLMRELHFRLFACVRALALPRATAGDLSRVRPHVAADAPAFPMIRTAGPIRLRKTTGIKDSDKGSDKRFG